MITAVGVVIPARDEATRIGACLGSVRAALQQLPGVAHSVYVALDRCTDDTESVVRAQLAGWAQARCGTQVRPIPLGTLRDRGSRRVLHALRGHPPSQTWLLHTDADTTVPGDWATQHHAHAVTGAHAVAGIAELAGNAPLPPAVAAGYRALVAPQRAAVTHCQVYGANLGIRADAYLAIGGFAPRSCGEDHDIVARLDHHGFRVAHPSRLRVTTSARTRGRADGGLADVLHTLHRHPNCRP